MGEWEGSGAGRKGVWLQNTSFKRAGLRLLRLECDWAVLRATGGGGGCVCLVLYADGRSVPCVLCAPQCIRASS